MSTETPKLGGKSVKREQNRDLHNTKSAQIRTTQTKKMLDAKWADRDLNHSVSGIAQSEPLADQSELPPIH